MLNIKAIQSDFPILKRKINGQKLVYLDNAATTQKPITVINKMTEFYEKYNANIHRGVYPLAEEATALYDEARTETAKFINADFEEIVFTKNATESINLVAYSWGRKNLKKGDNIILSVMEHHSNILPWQMLKKELGIELKYIDIDENEKLNLKNFDEAIDLKTKLIAITHISNTLGTINPVEKIITKAHEKNIKVLVDACQSIPHLKIDVKKINPDFLVFSGHKMLAPMGIGVLYGKKAILEEMPPFLLGGDMIKDVFLDDYLVNDLPYKFEAGTQNVAAANGLKEAILYLNKINWKEFKNYEQKLLKITTEELRKIPEVKIYGSKNLNEKIGIISFSVTGMHPHDLAGLLGEKGICARAGKHCTHPLLHRLGIEATLRVSFYLYNDEKDIQVFIKTLKEIIKNWKK